MGKRSVATFVSAVTFLIILTSVLVYFFMKVKVECHFYNSIDITGSHEFPNGSHKFENNIFYLEYIKEFDFIMVNGTQKVQVDSHLRGCVCAFKSCIRTCTPFDNITIYNEHNEKEIVNLKNTHYYVMVGKPCEKLVLDENDKWHFFSVSLCSF